MDRPTPEQLEEAKDNAIYNWSKYKRNICSYCHKEPTKIVWRPPNPACMIGSKCWIWSLCDYCKPQEEQEYLRIELNAQEIFYLEILP